ncbi:MAG: DNA repair protein RecN [Anaerolineaceae bacterium]|nr:DNA repair protein RecN [Anaerolineaceae bacterium]
MLEELRIENFAIIDRLELNFAPGFNVITGETGAGKSIIIDAVELLLGGKADSGMVRAGAEKAMIEGVFGLNSLVTALVQPILEREDLLEDASADYVTLTREIRSNGRSTARVNGITTNLDILKEVGAVLVDVHGQSEHLSLLNSRSHIDLLDRYADLMEMRLAVASVVERINGIRREIGHLLDDEAALKRRAEQLRHEVEEIEAAALKPGEDKDLLTERTRMANSEQLATLTGEALALLYGDDSGDGQMAAVDQLMQVGVLMQKLLNIDPKLKDDYELAESLGAQAEELSLNLRRYADTVEYNPERLDEVEERLELINKLRRRYGTTIELILEYAEKSRNELNGIEHSEERLTELREEEDKLLRHIGELGGKISRVRRMFGQKLGERIVKELADLRMERAQFEVSVTQQEKADGCFVNGQRLAFDGTGIDNVEFLMTANPGEPLRPLAQVASGGETARIMLALKRVLTQADQTPTLIFDEIDQGIGGRVGSVVGEKLWSLSLNHQVLVVTHLAQLASYGDRHYRVSKLIEGNRTRTQVIAMEDTARVNELVEMLGTQGESGVLSAQDILAQAQQYKKKHHTM